MHAGWFVTRDERSIRAPELQKSALNRVRGRRALG
jgi:hypothetical protein